jgi:hypothetical protein
MNKKAWALALTVGLLGSGSAAQAALVDAGNGLVNDTVLDICWVANAGLSGEPDQLNGLADWQTLVDWAANLDYGGYQDWRLASMSSTSPTNSVVNCGTDTEPNFRDNELGYMYTYYLPGNYGDDKTGNQTVGDVTLTGIQNGYWSGTEFASLPRFAWVFRPDFGLQGLDGKDGQRYGWAVRPGQCRAAPPPPSPQPIPAISVWGLGVLSLLLIVLARARLR